MSNSFHRKSIYPNNLEKGIFQHEAVTSIQVAASTCLSQTQPYFDFKYIPYVKLPQPRRTSGAAAPAPSPPQSRPSFRPRPIDLTKPLPIIKSSKDLRHEDDIVVNRALPTIATGVDPSEEEERHLKQALLASVFGGKQTADIPVPVFHAVHPPTIKGKFERSNDYIMFDRSDLDLEDVIIDYDADYVDEAFIKHLDTSKGEPLTLDKLERSMDILEKQQGRADTDSILPYNSMKPFLQDIIPNVTESVRKELYHHWVSRREKAEKPLSRLYQKAPDPNSNDPSVAFRPRERDSGVGLARRMNTYENFRRATVLREELTWLRDVLGKVIERENIKQQMLAMRFLGQRIKSVSVGGPRVEMVIRSIFGSDSEPVLVCGNGTTPMYVPCSGLTLPEEVPIIQKRLSTGDKASKKARRKATPRISTEKRSARDGYVVAGQNDARISGMIPTPGVDTFGFDEHGNKFLKQMRYFAGGFMNYGVSPYDHRVFAAASERNTVRCLPREPKPITFPSTQVKFGTITESHRKREGGKVGPTIISTDDVRKDIVGEKRAAELTEPNMFNRSKLRKTIRARGRVGRGGRIVFDRVTFERERGVKAASYPASVEMGGVYSGGIPLDLTSKVSEVVKTGAMGNIDLLGDNHEVGSNMNMSGEDGKLSNLAKKLIPPLQPMVQYATGIGMKPDILNYWPRRKGGKTRPKPDLFNVDDDNEEDINKNRIVISERTNVPDAALRDLPAYARRNEQLVTEI